jgi:sulfate transport system permease protein
VGAGAVPLSRAGALFDALVDLPFALPTAVAGITLTALLAKNGWIGARLEPLGIEVAYTPLGVTVALDLHRPAVRRAHRAARAPGPRARVRGGRPRAWARSRFVTFRRVLFPILWPALTTGFALAFARGVGEYGSVVFISAICRCAPRSRRS